MPKVPAVSHPQAASTSAPKPAAITVQRHALQSGATRESVLRALATERVVKLNFSLFPVYFQSADLDAIREIDDMVRMEGGELRAQGLREEVYPALRNKGLDHLIPLRSK